MISFIFTFFFSWKTLYWFIILYYSGIFTLWEMLFSFIKFISFCIAISSWIAASFNISINRIRIIIVTFMSWTYLICFINMIWWNFWTRRITFFRLICIIFRRITIRNRLCINTIIIIFVNISTCTVLNTITISFYIWKITSASLSTFVT